MERVRSRTAIGVVAASILLAALATGWISANGARAQQQIHILWPASSITTKFTGFGDGGTLGDRIAARGPLTDVGQSEQIGYAYLECVVMRKITDKPSGLWRCSYVLDLAPGQLVIEGMDPRGPGAYEMAVLGGSGGYADAVGDAIFTDNGVGTDMVISLVG